MNKRQVSGTASGYRQYTSFGIAVREDSYGINPNVGSTATQNDAISGMYVRKGSDLSLSQDLVSTYDHDYPFMRLAEVMFIYAEDVYKRQMYNLVPVRGKKRG